MRERGVWNGQLKDSGRNDEQVEETKLSETDEDVGDSSVDEVEVVGKGITKEEERGLEHEK